MKSPFRTSRRKRDKSDSITSEEWVIIGKCIRDGDVVLDVGAHHGKWTDAVLSEKSVGLHAFEASREAYDILQSGFGRRARVNWNAVTNFEEDVTFHVYRDDAWLTVSKIWPSSSLSRKRP